MQLLDDKEFLTRRYRFLIFALFALTFPFLVYGSLKALESNSNRVKDWLPEDFQQTQHLFWFIDHFTSDEILMISWPGCTLDNADGQLTKLKTMLLEPSPKSGKTFFRRAFIGTEVLDRLISEPLDLSRQAALRRLNGWLVGPDDSTTCVVAMVSTAGRDDRHQAVDWAFECASKVTGLDRSEIHIAGSTVDSVAIDRASGDTMAQLNLVCYAVCLTLMCLCFRNVQLAFMVFFMGVYGEVIGTSIVYFTGSNMDSILLMMASLVYVLGVSATIHLLHYYRDAIDEHGMSGAVVRAVRYAIVPCGLASATTALGLASLTVSRMVPISKFGAYSSVAVLLTFFALFLLFPSVLQQWPPKHSKHRGTRKIEGMEDWTLPRHWALLSGITARLHIPIIIVAFTALAFGVWGVSKITTSIRLHDMFPPDAKIIEDYDWLESNIGPLVPIEVVLRVPKTAELSVLDKLQFVEQVRRAIRDLDDVGATISAATFGPTLPKAGKQGAGSVSRRAIIRRRLQRHRKEFVDTQYLQVTDSEELWRISVRVGSTDNIDFAPFLDKVQKVVDKEIAEAPVKFAGTTNVLCGAVPLVHETQRQLLKDLIRSFGLAFAMIGLTMILLLRDVRAGILLMVPNLLPSALVFGVMGWIAVDVEIGSMMTASAALGIAVDDTLHFITWFRRGLGRGYSREKSVRFTYARCATAMTQTSMICGFGLLVFAMSNFVPIVRFGWLMFVLLGMALVGDLIVLPAILMSPLGRVFKPSRGRVNS